MFDYSYRKEWWFQKSSSWIWCCWRKKATRNEWLQKDAKAKLATESDLLEIIKKLRVH